MLYLFAGGGTGGHLMPGIALAQRARELWPGASLLFVASERENDRQTLERYHLPSETWGARRWTDWIDLPTFIAANSVAVFRAVARVRALRPAAIVALGGYASAFPAVAAVLLRKPLILLEQNVIPGKVNRLLARHASAICCQWQETARSLPQKANVITTGNPVRPELFEESSTRASRFDGLRDGALTVLVMGGSQGTHSINEVMPPTLPRLTSRVPDVQFLHLAGAADRETVAEAYQQAGARACVVDYLDDMAGAYRCADVVVSRAGGTSLAEITALGKASILIPYPHAADDHQRHNARVLGQAGAADVIDPKQLTPDIIAGRIEVLLRDEPFRRAVAIRASEFGRRDAADDVLQTIRGPAGTVPAPEEAVAVGSVISEQ